MFVDCLNIIIRDGFSVIYFKDTRIEKEISEKHSNKPSSDYKTAFYGKYIVHVHSFMYIIALSSTCSFHLLLGFHIYMHFIIHYFFVKSMVDIYLTNSVSFLYISHPRGIDSDCLRYYG